MCTAALDAEYQREVALSVPLLKSRLEKLHAYGCPSLNCIARPRPRAHVRARASGVAEKTLRFCSPKSTMTGALCWQITAAECVCGWGCVSVHPSKTICATFCGVLCFLCVI